MSKTCWKSESDWDVHLRRPHRQGWRRTDVYGFERYEDNRRDWYILSSEQEAARFEQHDLELEARCMDRLWALILGDTPVYAERSQKSEEEQAVDGLPAAHAAFNAST